MDEEISWPGDGGTLASGYDVVVVGGGFTGLSASLALARAGRSVLCLDRDRPGRGASTRNGGMAGAGHRLKFTAAARRYGEQTAIELIREGVASYRFTKRLIREHGIDCEFEECGRLRAAWSPAHFAGLSAELESLKGKVEIAASLVTRREQEREVRTPLYHGGLLYHEHGGLNPRKFHDGLARAAQRAGARVLADVEALSIRAKGAGFEVRTRERVIECGKVVVATNGYTPRNFRYLAARVLPVPSFIIATEPLARETLDDLLPGRRMMVETRNRYCYYRRAPDHGRILLGARAALTGIPQERATATLRELLVGIFPSLSDVALTHSWRGFTGFTFAHVPHVGCHEGIHFAMGYCGSGVAMAPYLGYKCAMQVLNAPEGRTAFSDTRFESRFYYRGRTWFMPLLNPYYSCKDALENRVARARP